MASSYEVGAFSFGDVSVSITGPNLATVITGVGEEGVTVAFDGDSSNLTMGADGSGMVSQRVAQNGTVSIRILKTSSFNKVLSDAYAFQRTATVNLARMRIIVRDPVRGDLITCQGCSFRKFPDLTFATNPNLNEWSFLAVRITPNLGSGIISTVTG